MLPGMSTACFFPGVPTEKSIDVMARMSVKNIEVFFCCLSEYSKPFVKELKKRISDNGINVYSVHALSLQFEPQLFSPYERARLEAQDIFGRVIEAAAELGAQAYVFHGPAAVKRARSLALDYRRIAPIAGRLADTAKDSGIKLAWENVHWCWYAHPEFASRLLEMPGTENLYFTLDIKQAAQAGYDPSDYIEHTKDRLVNIHVCDYKISEEKGVYPVLPFQGCTDFCGLKASLESTAYNGGIILEVYSSNYSDYLELEENYNRVKAFFL